MTKQEFLQGTEFRMHGRWYKFNSLGNDNPLDGCIQSRHDTSEGWVHCANIDRVSSVAFSAYTFLLGKMVRVYLKFAALPTGVPINRNSAC